MPPLPTPAEEALALAPPPDPFRAIRLTGHSIAMPTEWPSSSKRIDRTTGGHRVMLNSPARDTLSPWRAFAEAVYAPALIETVCRDWRARDPEARVRWDVTHSEQGHEHTIFLLAYRGYERYMVWYPDHDTPGTMQFVNECWRDVLERAHRAGQRAC